MDAPLVPRYDHVRQSAKDFLIDEEIASLPVDPFRLAQQHDLGPEPYSKLNLSYKEDGFLIRDRGIERIFYNDQVEHPERIRWTIMHEIGHAFLGHFQFDETLFRNGMTTTASGVLEVEAHLFASEVLAPSPVIRNLGIVDAYWKIAELCGISESAAMKRASHMMRYPFYHHHEQDEQILELFQDFLQPVTICLDPSCDEKKQPHYVQKDSTREEFCEHCGNKMIWTRKGIFDRWLREKRTGNG